MCQATRRDCKTKKVPNAWKGKPAAAPRGFFAIGLACSTTSVTPQRTSPLKPSAHCDVPTHTARKNNAILLRDVSTATGAASIVSCRAVGRTAQTVQLAQTAQTVLCHKSRGCQQFCPPPARNARIPGESWREPPLLRDRSATRDCRPRQPRPSPLGRCAPGGVLGRRPLDHPPAAAHN